MLLIFLAKSNKRKFAFVSGPLIDDINGKVRLAGYKEGLEKNGLSSKKVLSLKLITTIKMDLNLHNV